MQLMTPSSALTKLFVGINNTSNQKVDSEIDEGGSFHSFNIGPIGLLIPSETISELVEEVAYCQLPNTNTVLHGMANIRGKIIPIFDLHAYLDIETSKEKERKILVIGKGEDAAAVLIDEYPVRLLTTAENEFMGTPPIANELQEHVKACYQTNQKVWSNIDMTGLFSSLSQYI